MINLSDTRALSETQRALGPRFVDDLVHAAKRALQTALRGGSGLYHVGTTDLALVLSPEEPALHRILVRFRSALPSIVESSGVPVSAQATIGIAPFHLGEAPPLDVLRTAYGAALDAREAELEIETHSLLKDAEHRRRFSLLAGISQALVSADQFNLVYQPRIDVQTGRCVCAEALLRWRHPTLGNISAGEFIPLVEQTALAGPVTDWVLETALRQAASWLEIGLDLRVAVNVSAANLEDHDFPRRLGSALQRHAVPPAMIELEFTETALIRHRALVLEHLTATKALGVTCAIDDFGTGYSSFSYLLLPSALREWLIGGGTFAGETRAA